MFKGRHFQNCVIVLCCPYLRHCLAVGDLEEPMAERGLEVDHATIAVGFCGMRRNSTNGYVGECIFHRARRVDGTLIKVRGSVQIPVPRGRF
jgi:transposase-like protein